jgi:hypothetical protein
LGSTGGFARTATEPARIATAGATGRAVCASACAAATGTPAESSAALAAAKLWPQLLKQRPAFFLAQLGNFTAAESFLHRLLHLLTLLGGEVARESATAATKPALPTTSGCSWFTGPAKA